MTESDYVYAPPEAVIDLLNEERPLVRTCGVVQSEPIAQAIVFAKNKGYEVLQERIADPADPAGKGSLTRMVYFQKLPAN